MQELLDAYGWRVVLGVSDMGGLKPVFPRERLGRSVEAGFSAHPAERRLDEQGQGAAHLRLPEAHCVGAGAPATVGRTAAWRGTPMHKRRRKGASVGIEQGEHAA